MKNLSVRNKIILLVTPLVVTLLGFAFSAFLDQLNIYQNMQSLRKLAGVSVLTSAVVHDIQRERGLSAAYLGDQGERFKKRLRSQQNVTDTKIRILKLFLKKQALRDETKQFNLSLDQALLDLQSIGGIRNRVLSHKITIDEAMFYYSGIDELFLRNILSIGRFATNRSITSRVNAYSAILTIKESLGRERAILSNVLTGRNFSPGMYRQFVAVRARQQRSYDFFKLYASAGDQNFYNQKVPGELLREVRRIENLALARDEKLLKNVSDSYWWNLTTSKIRGLKYVEDKLTSELSSEVEGLRRLAQLKLLFHLLVALALLIATVVFTYFLERSIIRPITTLSQRMSKFDIHESDMAPPPVRHDEIGNLRLQFYDLGQKLKDALHGMEEKVERRTEELEDLNSRISKYLSPQLYVKIFQDKNAQSLTHERKKLTVFFSDIVGFTEATERMDPEEASNLLNSYLEEMSRIANNWGGTIDKYVGDAIMIFFGDPEFTSDRDHAVRCLGMAIEMLDKLKDLHLTWVNAGITDPFKVRMGINTGFCTVGNFGSEERYDYTIIGRQVNLASRIQTHAEPNSILISHATYNLIRNDLKTEYAGEYSFKGIDHKLKLYRVIGSSIADVAGQNFQANGQGYQILVDGARVSEGEREGVRRALKKAYRLVATDAELEKIQERKNKKKASI